MAQIGRKGGEARGDCGFLHHAFDAGAHEDALLESGGLLLERRPRHLQGAGLDGTALDVDRTRAAANSIASGSPSRRSTIPATAPAFSSSTVKPGTEAAARSANPDR